jgi:hypothetical protein
MNTEDKQQSRRGFLGWALAVAGLAGAAKVVTGKKKEEEPEKTVKFLSQDGKLVEVDASKIYRKRTKASDQEVLTWIKK